MILDIRSLSQKIVDSIAESVSMNSLTLKLVVIIVGSDPASEIYVRNKIRQCSVVGIEGEVLRFYENIDERELAERVMTLNNDPAVTGILIQSPLPRHISAQKIFNTIHPLKDVDGFCANNVTRLYSGDESGLMPCTPKGIMRIINWYFEKMNNEQWTMNNGGNILAGRNVVVIGKSTIVGKPVAMMLLNAGATVTVCHSRTKNLAEHTLKSDIVITAVWKKHLVTSEMVKPGALVIDVGINVEETDEKRFLFGDCDTLAIAEKADITPVPGGVGPMTIAMLLANILLAHSLQWKQ